MKLFNTRRKIAAVALAGVIIAAAAGSAAAFFTSTGTGTGSAAIASTSAFTVALATPTGPALAPGTPSGAATDNVTYTVTNPVTAASPAQLTQIVIEVTPGFDYVDGAGDPACTANDFSINGLAVGAAGTYPINQTLAAGASFASSFNIQLIDNGANQDSCAGGNVPLTVVAS